MRLSQSTLKTPLPYDRSKVTPGIVHLGIGAFHRAHMAVYVDDSLGKDPSWGIIGASLRRPDTKDALAPQDYLYTVAIRDAAGTKARVVSMPSTNVFDRQDQAYKDSVLIPGVKRVAVEAGVTDFWRKYVGLDGAVVGIDSFGESAPGGALFKHFGFTVENVVNTVKSVL